MSLKEKAKEIKNAVLGDKSLNRVYSSKKAFLTEEEARRAFGPAKERMFNVNTWGQIPGPENADFILHDGEGMPSNETRPSVGYHIKTLLPGGLPEDWVRVVDIQEGDDFASFTVRPCGDPGAVDAHPAETEHFFKSSATSTFRLEIQGNILVATETGYNESINNQGPEAGNRKVLNTVISEAGWLFAQKLQWENVTDYIVGNTTPKED